MDRHRERQIRHPGPRWHERRASPSCIPPPGAVSAHLTRAPIWAARFLSAPRVEVSHQHSAGCRQEQRRCCMCPTWGILLQHSTFPPRGSVSRLHAHENTCAVKQLLQLRELIDLVFCRFHSGGCYGWRCLGGGCSSRRRRLGGRPHRAWPRRRVCGTRLRTIPYLFRCTDLVDGPSCEAWLDIPRLACKQSISCSSAHQSQRWSRCHRPSVGYCEQCWTAAATRHEKSSHVPPQLGPPCAHGRTSKRALPKRCSVW